MLYAIYAPQNLVKLKALFPDLLTEGQDGVAVDVNVLKQLVGDRSVAETEEKALESARQFLWMDGEFTGRLKPVWASPSGYFSPSSRETFVNFVAGQGASPSRPRKSFEQQVADMQIIAGTPEQVVKSLRIIMRETRPGIMAFWGNEGRMTQEAARTSIRLLGQEVMPALRETAKELDLKSPFEADMPVSRAFAGKTEKVAAE